MKPVISAFEASPDEGQGHARDMRVRWAFEEVGQPYDVRLVSFKEMKEPRHLAINPFGKIPTFEQDGLALFESGAIVLHIAETHHGLLPADAGGKARAKAWMFAAVNTIEPPIVEREAAIILEKDRSWYEERSILLDERVRERLGQLSDRLGEADWLDGEFSAADLLMVTVLRRLEASNLPDNAGILAEYPNLFRYVERGEARPAYRRAFADQLAVFERLSDAES